MKKEDFKLNLQGDMFTVSFGEQQNNQQENKDEGWIRREYRKRSFSRSFHLDDTIDAGKISAHYENGLLHVTLPKKENAQKISRVIEVS